MSFVQKDHAPVAGKVGCKACLNFRLFNLFIGDKTPSHMRPKKSFKRAMRIAFFVGISVMHPVSGDPANRASLTSQTSAKGEKIFQYFRNFKASMGEESMIAKGNAHSSGNPVKYGTEGKRLPAKSEKEIGRASCRERV